MINHSIISNAKRDPDVTKNLKVHSFMPHLRLHAEVFKRCDTFARHLQYIDSYTRTFCVPLSFGSKYGVAISLLVKFISYFCVCASSLFEEKKHDKKNNKNNKIKPKTHKIKRGNHLRSNLSVNPSNFNITLYSSFNLLKGVINQITVYFRSKIFSRLLNAWKEWSSYLM